MELNVFQLLLLLPLKQMTLQNREHLYKIYMQFLLTMRIENIYEHIHLKMSCEKEIERLKIYVKINTLCAK